MAALKTYLQHHLELGEFADDMIVTVHALQFQVEIGDRSDALAYFAEVNVDAAVSVAAETVDLLRLL